MMQLPIIVLLTVTLSGCTKSVWDKPGATQADYNSDSYTCEKDTRQSGYFGGGLVGSINMQDFFDRCMVAHGYTKQVVSASPPPYHGDPASRVVVGPPGKQSVLDGTGRYIGPYTPP